MNIRVTLRRWGGEFLIEAAHRHLYVFLWPYANVAYMDRSRESHWLRRARGGS